MIIYSPNPTFVPSLSEIGDLSCITSCLVLPGFLMDTLLIRCVAAPESRMSWLLGNTAEENRRLAPVLIFLTVSAQGLWKRVSELC